MDETELCRVYWGAEARDEHEALERAIKELEEWGQESGRDESREHTRIGSDDPLKAAIRQLQRFQPGGKLRHPARRFWIELTALVDQVPLDGTRGEALREQLLAALQGRLDELGEAGTTTPVVTDQGESISPALAKWIKDLPPDDTPGLRPAGRRDHLWLLWHQQERDFGPTKIRDRWNALAEQQRAVVSPRCSGEVTAVVVKRGIRQARKDEAEAKSEGSRKPGGGRRSRKKN